jgi:hypothetical protein
MYILALSSASSAWSSRIFGMKIKASIPNTPQQTPSQPHKNPMLIQNTRNTRNSKNPFEGLVAKILLSKNVVAHPYSSPESRLELINDIYKSAIQTIDEYETIIETLQKENESLNLVR